jgi:hypothetical protein
MRLLLLGAIFGAVISYADDIIIPLEGGSIVVQPQFIRVNEHGYYVPELSFRILNQTQYPWRAIKLRFDIGGLCRGEPRQWQIPAVTSVGWSESGPISNEYKDTVIPLVGKVDGCTTEIIKTALLMAENQQFHIDGVTGERVDLEKQLREINARREAEIKAKRDVKEAEKAQEERTAAEEEAKKDAAEAARRKRLAAERKRKDAEAQARYAKAKAEEDARAAEERAKIRAACALIYENTANKKVGDLTVKEEQEVRACQALGLYRAP